MNVVLSRSVPRVFIAAGVVLFFSSCQMLWSPNTPKHYVLPRPKKMILDEKLNEISGLCFVPRENTLLAIADDKKKIYRLTTDGNATHYFHDDIKTLKDCEDVVKVDSVVYALNSNGMITEAAPTDSGVQVQTFSFWSAEKNDFETLYYDAGSNGLIMLCKSCAEDKGEGQRTAYRFDLARKAFDTAPFYTISTKAVQDKLKDGKIDFKPSAAAIHPLEKRLYILSSAGNLMVIADLKGSVQEVYRLNPTFYPQAEGIAFAPNGDLYISNEAKLGKPTLLYIPYKPSGK